MEERNTAQELFDLLKQRIEGNYPGVTVEKTDVVKNNGVLLTGAVIRNENESIAPTIYLNQYAENIDNGEMTFNVALNDITESYEESLSEMPSSVTIDRDNAKGRLYAVVVNREKNDELLKGIPHKDIVDLSMVARYAVTDSSSFLVTNQTCGLLGMEPSEVIECAERNALSKEYSVRSMSEVLVEMIPDMPQEIKEEMVAQQDAAMPMVVISNKDKTYGAIGPFISEELRAEIRNKVGGEFYLLPSSIHECIAVPANAMEAELLADIVREVNMKKVADTEVLSDNPYFVSADLKLSIAGEGMAMEKSIVPSESLNENKHMSIKI